MARVICFDIETTALDYTNGEKIIEIGAIEIIDGVVTGQSFHEYVNPDGRKIPIESYNVHKLSNTFLADKPHFPDVAKRFLEFIGDHDKIVAHNGKGFDFPFINYQLQESGFPKISPDRQEDTMLMAQRKIAELRSYSLDSLAKYFNVSLEARAEAHGALIDTEILAKIYLELTEIADGKTVAEVMAEQHAKFLEMPKSDGKFPRRKFPPTDAEIAIHDEWMDKNFPKTASD